MFFLAYGVSGVFSFYFAVSFYSVFSFITTPILNLVMYEIFGKKITGRMIGLAFISHQIAGQLYDATGTYKIAIVASVFFLLNSAFWAWQLRGAAKRYISRFTTGLAKAAK